jgi:hypothetical protein
MDEVRIVKHRTHIWPVIIALVVLAIVIAYVFFAINGPSNQVGWNPPSLLLSYGETGRVG